jgi:predicted Zn-dependent peptidase
MRVKFRGRTPLSLLLVAIMAVSMLASVAEAGKREWEKIDYPELGDVQMPNYERHTLENGMSVFLMRDTSWPLVNGQALVHTGSIYEPASKVGLASVTGDVLRTGGTTNIAADDLDAKLESMGAYIESNIGQSSGSVNFSFVDKDAAAGMRLVADVLRNPAFDQDKMDVSITGQRAGISRRNDDLNGIVGREVQKAVWGADHPYARHAEYATLESITRDDMVEFYEYFYVPNNIMLVVTGNFETAEMMTLLEESFGSWEAQDNPIPEISKEPTASASRRVTIANKDDVTQARFAVGQVGMRADDPDFYAMSVMNRILGGGFGDRLFNEVRSNLGLAYNVGSTSGAQMSRVGTFQAYCGTKNDTADQALGAVLGEIDRIRDTDVTDEELSTAKESILNSHVFNFVSKAQILNRIVTYEYLGYPADYLESYTTKVRGVDKAAVRDVATRRVNPDEFAIVAVGKVDEFDGDLTSYGPVSELDITIPEPEGEEFPEATDETVEKGRAILAGAQGAMGGGSLTAMKTIAQDAQVGLSIQGMELSATLSAKVGWPDRAHTTINLPFGEMLQVVDAQGGWSKSPQGMEDMSADDAETARLKILQDPYFVLANFDGFAVQALDAEEVEGVVADVVLVWITETSWEKLYFDASSHRLMKTAAMEDHPMMGTPGLMESFYSEFKPVSGIDFAHKVRITHGGEPLMELTMTNIEVNVTIDDAIFAKPSS